MKFNNRNIYISPKAKIGRNVKIGDNASIYDNVIIGDNCIICNDCIIGEPMNSYYYDTNYSNSETLIGNNALIRSHTIIYSGCKIGNDFSTGHRVTIRENSVIGNSCRIGTLSDLQGNIIIKDHVWLHSNVHVGQNSIINNYVFLYPFVVLTNDPKPPSNDIFGPEIGEFSQIAVNSVILPGVRIGQHCLIGANSTVVKDCENYSLVLGSPAKTIKDVRDMKDVNGQELYPWPVRFDRGMPWEGMNYAEWKKRND